jgi:succinate dehydrogenase / fumarate reductase iron-sulfur subunit
MKERVVDRRYDPIVWLGRKILRRDELDAHGDPSNRTRPTPGSPNVTPPLSSARLPENAPVGPDGHMDIAELVAPTQGGLSPFGEDLSFPLPPEHVSYHHPKPGKD